MAYSEKLNSLSEQLHAKIKNSGDRLTPLQRHDRVFIEHGKPDFAPIYPFYREFQRKLVGYTVKELELDPMKECESILACLCEYDFDTVWPNVDSYSMLPESVGVPIIMPEDSCSVTKEAIVKKPEQLKDLPIYDPRKDGRLYLALEQLKILKDTIGDIYPIMGNIGGPGSLASAIRGANKFMVDLKRNPEFVRELLDYCADTVIAACKEIAAIGVAGILLPDAPADEQVIGVKYYNEFMVPAYHKILEAVKDICPLGVNWRTSLPTDMEQKEAEAAVENSLKSGNKIIHGITEWIVYYDVRSLLEIIKEYDATLFYSILPDEFATNTPQSMDCMIKDIIQKCTPGFEGNFAIGPNIISDLAKPDVVKAYTAAVKECKY